MVGMIDDAELSKALETGAGFKPAIRSVDYKSVQDELVFGTQWGNLTFARKDVPIFRDVAATRMKDVYVSEAGIHIDDLDLDVNSAGLLEAIFRELGNSLASSY